MSFQLAELERRFNNILVIGTISAVNEAEKQCRVKLDMDTASGDEVLTGWLPWPAEIGRNFIRWRPLRIGAQVLLACPQGDPENAIVIQMLYSARLAPPSTDPELDMVQFNDGTLVEYHSGNKQFSIKSAGDITFHATGNVAIHAAGELCKLSSAGNIEIDAGGDLKVTAAGSHTLEAASHNVTGPTTINDPTTINAATTINGATTMAGAVNQSGGEMKSNGVSVDKHVHGGITSGPAKTGKPE